MTGHDNTAGRDIFAERAFRLARRLEPTDAGVLAAVAVVTCGRETYGLPVANLRTIVAISHVAPIPGLPPFYRGLAQIRGDIVAVLDFCRWQGIEQTREPAFIAVTEAKERVLGLLIDDVKGFRSITAAAIAEQFAVTGGSNRHIQWVTRDLVAVLDLAAMLADERLVVDREN